MSVIAVKVNEATIDLCSDSFIGGIYQQSKIEFAKSFQVNEIAIGGSGSAEELSLLKIFCQNHSPTTVNEDGVIDFFVEFRAQAGPGESAGRWFPPPSTAHSSSLSSLYPRRERGRRSRSNPRASSTRYRSWWEREPR